MALFKGSRYEATPPFQPDATGRQVFRGLTPRTLGNPEAVLEHVVSHKDRLDSLAQNYYSRPGSWYRIAEANPDFLFPEDILHQLAPDEQTSVADLERDSGAERLGAIILIPRREDF